MSQGQALSHVGFGRLSRLLVEREVEMVAVGVDAQHLVGQRLGGSRIQEDLGAVALDGLISVLRLRRVGELQLQLAVDLFTRDAESPHFAQHADCFVADLQHRETV